MGAISCSTCVDEASVDEGWLSKETDDDEALLLLELEDVTLVLVFVAVEDCLLWLLVWLVQAVTMQSDKTKARTSFKLFFIAVPPFTK